MGEMDMREAIELARKYGLLPEDEVPKYPMEKFVDYQDLAEKLEEFYAFAIQRGRELERDELSKQEPVGEIGIDTAYEDMPFGTKLYAKPMPKKNKYE